MRPVWKSHGVAKYSKRNYGVCEGVLRCFCVVKMVEFRVTLRCAAGFSGVT